MIPREVTALLAAQAGVVARRQALRRGLDDNDIERLVRRREWARVHPGVYADHTGPLLTVQRHWAAVLWCWPAVLYGDSALEAYGVRPTWRTTPHGSPVHVGICHTRRARSRDGVKVHRVVDLDRLALWNLGPPRLRIEPAVLTTCAGAPTPEAALAIAADMCQDRRITAERLLGALDASTGGRRRMRHGAFLRTVLLDVCSGTLSLLEHQYLTRVERAHGLPTGQRQRPERNEHGSLYRDVRYPAHRLLIELDGRIGHEWTAERWDDMDRDLDAGAQGELTLRLGWRHAVSTPCHTAQQLARTLQARGWTGRPQPCGPTCLVTGPL